MSKDKIFGIRSPEIKVEESKSSGSGWISSGQVVYSVEINKKEAASISISFKNAASGNEAITKTHSELVEILDQFRGFSPPSTSK